MRPWRRRSIEHAQVGDLPAGDGQHHGERGWYCACRWLSPATPARRDCARLAVAAEDVLHLEAQPLRAGLPTHARSLPAASASLLAPTRARRRRHRDLPDDIRAGAPGDVPRAGTAAAGSAAPARCGRGRHDPRSHSFAIKTGSRRPPHQAPPTGTVMRAGRIPVVGEQVVEAVGVGGGRASAAVISPAAARGLAAVVSQQASARRRRVGLGVDGRQVVLDAPWGQAVRDAVAASSIEAFQPGRGWAPGSAPASGNARGGSAAGCARRRVSALARPSTSSTRCRSRYRYRGRRSATAAGRRPGPWPRR